VSSYVQHDYSQTLNMKVICDLLKSTKVIWWPFWLCWSLCKWKCKQQFSVACCGQSKASHMWCYERCHICHTWQLCSHNLVSDSCFCHFFSFFHCITINRSQPIGNVLMTLELVYITWPSLLQTTTLRNVIIVHQLLISSGGFSNDTNCCMPWLCNSWASCFVGPLICTSNTSADNERFVS